MPYTLKSGLLVTATLIAASSAVALANADEWNKEKKSDIQRTCCSARKGAASGH